MNYVHCLLISLSFLPNKTRLCQKHYYEEKHCNLWEEELVLNVNYKHCIYQAHTGFIPNLKAHSLQMAFKGYLSGSISDNPSSRVIQCNRHHLGSSLLLDILSLLHTHKNILTQATHYSDLKSQWTARTLVLGILPWNNVYPDNPGTNNDSDSGSSYTLTAKSAYPLAEGCNSGQNGADFHSGTIKGGLKCQNYKTSKNWHTVFLVV